MLEGFWERFESLTVAKIEILRVFLEFASNFGVFSKLSHQQHSENGNHGTEEPRVPQFGERHLEFRSHHFVSQLALLYYIF